MFFIMRQYESTTFPVVGPENSRQLIMLKKLVYRAMLQTYELCVFFHDHFLDGRIPLPTVPAA